jgi:murein DD-endopeptidase MepM/ murein hydrolase activator NlpD
MKKKYQNFMKNKLSKIAVSGTTKRLKNKVKGILIILTVIMVISSVTIPSFANEIEQAKDEKTSLEKKKEETELRLSELEKEKGDILKYIEKLDGELNRLSEEINILNQDIRLAATDLETAREELELARLTEENQYTIMKKRIQYMYENGETEYLDVIMKSESIFDLLNHVEYMSKITEYDNSLLERYKAIKEDVIEKETILEEKLATLNDLKDELTFEQETVEHLVSEKNEELVKYNESISETEALTDEYNSKILEQEELIEELIEAERLRIEAERKAEEERKRKEEEERKRREEEERKRQEQENNNASTNNSATNHSNDSDRDDSGSNSSTSAGDLIWPVPSSGRITSVFGYREQPTAGASTYHKGIDIGAPTGTDIVASARGTVIISTYSVSAGNYIMLSHGNGIYTVYMHCSKLYVSVGDEVSRGERIALVGSTGFSTGPHLHFGVSINGTYVDPQDYVSY